MKEPEIRNLLEQKVRQYNHPDFIPTDPIQVPHRFTEKEDIEISGFLAAVIAWGQRITIINNANRLLEWMDYSPASFIRNFKESDLKPFTQFVHRTFNADDCIYFLNALKLIYREKGGLEHLLRKCFQNEGKVPGSGWNTFKNEFFAYSHLPRTEKHLPDPLKGSGAKRMNMYLRWMVRKDNRGVDFGIWKSFDSSELYIPLDVHTARVARKIGLLERKQNDWKSVLELNDRLRKFDPEDPVKYDFALFGMGAFEKY